MFRFIAFASLMFFASASSAIITKQSTKFANNETLITLTVNPSGNLDILFVIDDSGSMSTHQQNLLKNVKAFTDAFKPGSNINAGVITTSTQNFGSLSSPCCGQIKGPVLNSNDPSFLSHLASALNVGVNGDATEMPFQTIKSALSEPHLSGVNKGLIRPQADLMIVMLTDTQDQSPAITAADLAAHVKQLKPSNSIYTLAGHILDPKTCVGEEHELGMPYKKIEDFVSIFGGTRFDLCGNFSQNLTDALSKIGSVEHNIVLPVLANTKVDFGSVQVKLNGQPLQAGDLVNGWVFDGANNTVILGQNIFANGVGQVVITYKLK